ncbi:response regulator [Sphingomonas morindae]|uniref:Response regulator n=1 Tax=Sphingomonas morindae TaxID=1541170 RepID=A0ABY4X475_9SPHN|nr:response regulator [Sphingomonas morindae]USI71707.1 response regulator [Sphingomonas morindae]
MKTRANIVILEDESALREELVELVTLLGCDSIAAATGAEALAALHAHPVSLLLCDLHLQRESGFELLRAIHRDSRFAGRRPRIVAMTGHTDLLDSRRQDLDGLADRLLLKPISIATLRGLLATEPTDG